MSSDIMGCTIKRMMNQREQQVEDVSFILEQNVAAQEMANFLYLTAKYAGDTASPLFKVATGLKGHLDNVQTKLVRLLTELKIDLAIEREFSDDGEEEEELDDLDADDEL